MRVEINGVTMVLIAYRRVAMQASPRGEVVALFSGVNNETKEHGHVRFVYEWVKRDVVFEELATTNALLFVTKDNPEGRLDESPSAWIDVHGDDYGPEPASLPVYDECGQIAYGERD